MLSVYDKIQNACFQLNHDAYILQSSQKKHMRQFSPCEKSLVLLACLREETHFGMAMAVASRTQCNCHNSLSEDGLWAMCFDDMARKKHYAGAARHLTKRVPDFACRCGQCVPAAFNRELCEFTRLPMPQSR